MVVKVGMPMLKEADRVTHWAYDRLDIRWYGRMYCFACHGLS